MVAGAVADDVDEIRAALDIGRLDLLGDSYGTFLWATYAQRHPGQVRSVVLSGAYAVHADSAGSVAARGLIRAVQLAGERTGAFDGAMVLTNLEALATRLRARPEMMEFEFEGHTYAGPPDPDAQAGLAVAAGAATAGDLAPIRAVVGAHLRSMAEVFEAGPSVYAGAASWATACHDYPRPFDHDDDTGVRADDLAAAIAAQQDGDFGPFSAAAWLTRDSYDLGACLYWPQDPTAEPPFPVGAEMPEVPVLVLSGDLDANTTSESGRAAAAQFPNADWVEVMGAGHTPKRHRGGAGAHHRLHRNTTMNARPGDVRSARELRRIRWARTRQPLRDNAHEFHRDHNSHPRH